MNNRVKNIFRNQKGFSLVEIVLFISISSIIVWSTIHILSTQVNAYSFMANRQSTLSDARYALSLMSNELMRVESTGITAVSDSSINFIDGSSLNTSFESGDFQGLTTLMRGNEPLLSPITSLAFEYYDQNNNLLADPPNQITAIRRIKIMLTTAAIGNEGNLTLTTTITPRVYIYEDYQ